MRFSRTRLLSIARFVPKQRLAFLCLLRYSPQGGLHMFVSLSYLHMFPLRATQYRHPLPHACAAEAKHRLVIGVTVSEYYEMI